MKSASNHGTKGMLNWLVLTAFHAKYVLEIVIFVQLGNLICFVRNIKIVLQKGIKTLKLKFEGIRPY